MNVRLRPYDARHFEFAANYILKPCVGPLLPMVDGDPLAVEKRWIGHETEPLWVHRE